MMEERRSAWGTSEALEKEERKVSEEDDEKRGPRRMLMLDQVLELVPVGRTTLMRMIDRKEFPGGHFISPNKRVWYVDEIEAWQRSLPAESRRKKQARRAKAAQMR
jgi:prophage regulatory protein